METTVEELEQCECCDAMVSEIRMTADYVSVCVPCWDGMVADRACHAEECECPLCVTYASTEGKE